MDDEALYARVSTGRQEREETIQSQLAELRARAGDDGFESWLEFNDQGYSRDDLVRPGLDRLRDLVAHGEIKRIYVQSPDRLASGARLLLLVEEFQEQGVEVVFLKGSVEDTPEGRMLLGMQGIFADYERTKIAERTRRGKLYWAQHGALVGGHAPFGYRFIRRSQDGRARLEIDDTRAPIVRQMYAWLIEEHQSTRAVARSLTEAGVATSRGATQWQPTAVDRILRNPTYKGVFYFQRARSVVPNRRRTTDPYKQHGKTGREPRPEKDWIAIPVPPIVDESRWEAAQAQLHQNSIRSSRNNIRHPYLLRGLIRCPRCGAVYTGYARKGYRAYRCSRTDPSLSSTGQRCTPGSIPAEAVEEAVWAAVTEAVQHPTVLKAEYERRLAESASVEAQDAERKQIAVAIKRLKGQEDRVTDAYVREIMDLDRYKAEMDKLRHRLAELEQAGQSVEQRTQREIDMRRAVAHLERFCSQVSAGLEGMTFDERQELMRLLVERVTVESASVRVETVIPLDRDGITGPSSNSVSALPDGHLRARRPEPVEVRTNACPRWSASWASPRSPFECLRTNGAATPHTRSARAELVEARPELSRRVRAKARPRIGG